MTSIAHRAAKEKIMPHIRWMIRRDMPEVLETEAACFYIPWVEEAFLSCLSQRNIIGMVSEIGEKVVGFMIYALEKHILEVLNFAVHPDWQRCGIGMAMALKLASKLSSYRRTQIVLECSESNLDAQLFWRSQGFRAIRVRRDFYKNGEDAFTFRYDLESEWSNE